MFFASEATSRLLNHIAKVRWFCWLSKGLFLFVRAWNPKDGWGNPLICLLMRICYIGRRSHFFSDAKVYRSCRMSSVFSADYVKSSFPYGERVFDVIRTTPSDCLSYPSTFRKHRKKKRPDRKEQIAPNQREKVLAKASGKAERNLKNI